MKTKQIFCILIISCSLLIFNCTSPSNPKNSPPQITEISAVPDTLQPGGTSSLSCSANDPDDDQLTYTWEAVVGIIEGSGSSVYWKSPNTIGSFSVSCKVDDGNGGQDIESVNLSVLITNNPPIITSLNADPDSVFIQESATITCTATDPDNDILIYNWQTTAGTINGSGAVITWNAPDSVGIYSIKCKVNDGINGSDSSMVNIVVKKNKIPTDGLIAYYPFNGNANDESWNGHDGTIYGAAEFVSDRFSNSSSAFNLDGIDDYVNIGNNLKPNLPISVSLWFKNNGVIHMLFCNDDLNSSAYYHGFWLIGDLQVGIGSGYASGNTRKSIVTNSQYFNSLGDWHHIVGMINSANEMYLYVDGIDREVTYYGNSTHMTYSSSDGLIGRRIGGGGGYTNGVIDDIRVYNKILTKEEIQLLFNE